MRWRVSLRRHIDGGDSGRQRISARGIGHCPSEATVRSERASPCPHGTRPGRRRPGPRALAGARRSAVSRAAERRADPPHRPRHRAARRVLRAARVASDRACGRNWPAARFPAPRASRSSSTSACTCGVWSRFRCLILAQGLAHRTTTGLLPWFVRSGLIPEARQAQLREVVHGVQRLRNATLPWIAIAGLVIAWTALAPVATSADELSWAVEAHGGVAALRLRRMVVSLRRAPDLRHSRARVDVAPRVAHGAVSADDEARPRAGPDASGPRRRPRVRRALRHALRPRGVRPVGGASRRTGPTSCSTTTHRSNR